MSNFNDVRAESYPEATLEFDRELDPLLGGVQGEGLWELEEEGEAPLFEDEAEFGWLKKRIGGFVRSAVPVLKGLAKVAAPLVGTAVAGPLGGLIGSAASRLLGEQEGYLESEGESEADRELDREEELSGSFPAHEALAEQLAALASNTPNSAEAEALTAAAVVATLTAKDRAALRAVIPNLVRGASVLTKLLRKHPAGKRCVRVIPAIVRRTAKTLQRQPGAPAAKKANAAATVMAAQTAKVLRNPRRCAKALERNVRAARAAKKTNSVSASQ